MRKMGVYCFCLCVALSFGCGDGGSGGISGSGGAAGMGGTGGVECTPSPELCNGIDDDCNDVIDDDPECIDELCDNAIDDDGDGDVDCDDSECAEASECIDELCDNEVDDDGDGDVDCDDSECAEVLGCSVPTVGTTGDTGVADGADWEVCRADEDTVWVSGGVGGGTYDTTTVCQALGYLGADMFGGNCNTVCGYCGTVGNEQYDGAGAGFPNMYHNTVNWRCTRGFIPPLVGMTGNEGVADGADWEICRADLASAWISGGDGGGTYDANTICQFLGYDAADEFGGNCNTVCGYCGTIGDEQYDGAGAGFPDMYHNTVNWRCVHAP